MDAHEALDGEEGATAQTLVQSNGGESSEIVIKDGISAVEEEGPSEKTLELAEELFAKGSKAINDGDFVEAVDCLSRALEIRVTHFGELASECSASYYMYGCALLYKAQEETDPLGDVPKNRQKKPEVPAALRVEQIESAGDVKKSDVSTKSEDEKEVQDKKNADVEESESDEEDLMDGDEEESDLDLAWKMLDVARVIVEKSEEDTLEKVNIFASLGEVSLEREDIETSLSDYLKALSILEKQVEPDHRRVIELNFRVCLVLEVGSRTEEAIPYCQKAISLCSSRLCRLKENPSGGANEVEELSGILSELEKKLEDLQQAMENSKPVRHFVRDMLSSIKASGSDAVAAPASSSQLAVASSSSGFNSPKVSTASASNDGVTHLGVVGRGVKRAVVVPVDLEVSTKKPLLEPADEKADTSRLSEVLESTAGSSECDEKMDNNGVSEIKDSTSGGGGEENSV